MLTRKKPLPPIGAHQEKLNTSQQQSNTSSENAAPSLIREEIDNRIRQNIATYVATTIDTAKSRALRKINRTALEPITQLNKNTESNIQSLVDSKDIEKLISAIASSDDQTKYLITSKLKEKTTSKEDQEKIITYLELHTRQTQDEKTLDCHLHIINNTVFHPSKAHKARTCGLNIVTTIIQTRQSNGKPLTFTNDLNKFLNEALSHKDTKLRINVLKIINNFLTSHNNCKQLIRFKILQKIAQLLSSLKISTQEFNLAIGILSVFSQQYPETVEEIVHNIKGLTIPSHCSIKDLQLSAVTNVITCVYKHDKEKSFKLMNMAVIRLLAFSATIRLKETSNSAIRLLTSLIPEINLEFSQAIYSYLHLESLLIKANQYTRLNQHEDSDDIILLLTNIYNAVKKTDLTENSRNENTSIEEIELIKEIINVASSSTFMSYKIANSLFSYLEKKQSSIKTSIAIFLIAGLATDKQYQALIYHRKGHLIIWSAFSRKNNIDFINSTIICEALMEDDNPIASSISQILMKIALTCELKQLAMRAQAAALRLAGKLVNSCHVNKMLAEELIVCLDTLYYLQSENSIFINSAAVLIAEFAKNNKTPSFFKEDLCRVLLNLFTGMQVVIKENIANTITEILFNHPEFINLFKSDITTQQFVDVIINSPRNNLSKNMLNVIQRFTKIASHSDHSLLEAAGKGSFGIVRKVEDKQTGKLFAAKYPHHIKQSTLKILAHEAKILQSISHNNIVSFKGLFFYQDDMPPMIMMEWADGGSLSQRIHASSEFNWHDRIFYILGVIAAVQHLHQHDYLHRDIKSSNIIIQDSKAKLADVGGIQKINYRKEHIGTPGYIAPEFLTEQSQIYNTTHSDIWAFAITLLELITRKKPTSEVKDKAFKELLLANQFSSTIPNDTPGMPSGLEKIVIQATMFSPEDRSTAAEARHALEYIRSTMA